MAEKSSWEFASLRWLHRVRERHYKKTKALPLKAWLQPVDARTVAEACRRMGLNVRLPKLTKRQVRRPA